MGFCILGGKENYLRKIISDKLTSLGQATNIGATPATYSTNIQNIYDNRYTAGQDSLKTNRKLTLTSSQTGSNADITDNWYTSVDASAVYNAGKTAGASEARVGDATDADVRSGKTYTNTSGSGRTGSMPTLTSSNFAGSFSSGVEGAAANYNVTALSAGYVANGTNVLSTAAGSSSTISTTSSSGIQSINCIPGIYNKISVNQTPAYNAGAIDGRGAGKAMVVYSLQTSNTQGTIGEMRESVTQTLPAGTYHCAVHLYTHGNGATYLPTVTLQFGSTTRIYHDSIPSTGTGSYETGNIISIIDTFTLSANTTVTLSISKYGTNYGMSNGIAAIY